MQWFSFEIHSDFPLKYTIIFSENTQRFSFENTQRFSFENTQWFSSENNTLRFASIKYICNNFPLKTQSDFRLKTQKDFPLKIHNGFPLKITTLIKKNQNIIPLLWNFFTLKIPKLFFFWEYEKQGTFLLSYSYQSIP